MTNQIKYCYYSPHDKIGLSDAQIRNIQEEFHTEDSKSAFQVTNSQSILFPSYI